MTPPQQVAYLAKTAHGLSIQRVGRLIALTVQVPALAMAPLIAERLSERLRKMGLGDVSVQVVPGGPTRILAAEFARLPSGLKEE